jgi:hypothetical protein
VHGQTTALGVDIKGPPVESFQSGGNVLFNFLGNRPVLNQSTPFLLRAYGDLKNENWRIGFGVAPDLFPDRFTTLARRAPVSGGGGYEVTPPWR